MTCPTLLDSHPPFASTSHLSFSPSLACSLCALAQHNAGVAAALDHLGPTLVPAPDGASSAGSPRRTGLGKATGERARATLPVFAGENAKAATAGWSIDDRPPDSCGKRHVDAPTHEPVSFDLAHVVVPTTGGGFGDGGARTPRAAVCTPAAYQPPWARSASTGAPLQPTPSQPPAFDAQLSARSRADSVSAYDRTRTRGAASVVFSDLSYPTSAVDAI